MSGAADSTRQSHVMWQRRLAHELALTVHPLGAGLLALTTEGAQSTLRSLHVRDGSENWNYALNTPDCLSLVRTRQIAICVAPTTLTAIHAGDGHFIHQTQSKPNRTYTRAVAAKKGLIHIISTDSGTRIVETIDARTGHLLWETPIPVEDATSIEILVAGERVICIMQRPGKKIWLVAYDREKGQLVWQRDDIEGEIVAHWYACNLFDLIVARQGVWGINSADGSDRSLRFHGMHYTDARIVGQSFLAVTEDSDIRELLCLDTLSSELRGKLPADIERVVGAHSSEVLTEHPDGYPELFSLPKLEPVVLSEAKAIGRTAEVAWARDVAYLIAKDRRTVTALDLRFA